jgi:hypothetical protein
VEEPEVQAEEAGEETPEPEPEQPSEPVVDNEVDESNEAKGVSRRRSRVTENATLTAAEVFEQLDENKPVLLTRVGENEFLVTAASEEQELVPKKVKKIPTSVFETEEFREWQEDWSSLTYEKKKAYAKKNKIEWDEVDEPGIDAMRIGMAVREAEGVEKYVEGYETQKARNAAKAKIMAGETIEGLPFHP